MTVVVKVPKNRVNKPSKILLPDTNNSRPGYCFEGGEKIPRNVPEIILLEIGPIGEKKKGRSLRSRKWFCSLSCLLIYIDRIEFKKTRPRVRSNDPSGRPIGLG